MKKIICKLIGHRWKLKSHSDNMQDYHSIFLHGASRRCTRCSKMQISYRTMEEADMYFI